MYDISVFLKKLKKEGVDSALAYKSGFVPDYLYKFFPLYPFKKQLKEKFNHTLQQQESQKQKKAEETFDAEKQLIDQITNMTQEEIAGITDVEIRESLKRYNTLLNNKLWLSDYYQLNDPFEFCGIKVDKDFYDETNELERLAKNAAELRLSLNRNTVKISCFSDKMSIPLWAHNLIFVFLAAVYGMPESLL